MNGGRIALLGTAVVLLIVGVVCLKQRLGYQEIPPAFVPGEVAPTETSETHVTHQPTILPADPDSGSGNLHRPWQDPDPIPASNLRPGLEPTFPIRTETAPVESLPAWDETRPIQLAPPVSEAAPASEPAPLPPTAEVEPIPTQPLVVVSKQDDSLWTISQQAYGQGIYYRALFAVNRERIPRPDRIEAGIEIHTPPLEELRKLYPDLCPVARNEPRS